MRRSSSDRNDKVVWRLIVENASVGEHCDENHGEGEADGADVVAEENCGRLDANYHVVLAILAGVDRV